MSKKTRTLSNKAGKLMKCDGQMLKKVIEAKGYKLYELSKMLRYCSDYLTTCCRQNKISDVAVKYLMDYKIFPQMYGVEGEIKVDEPKEIKIDKDEKKIEFGTPYGIVRSEKDLRKYIRQALTKGPHWGTDLMTMRDILNKARANGLSYDVEDMRKDMFAYASNLVDGDSEKWMHFVDHLNLKNDPTDQEIDVSEDFKKYVESDKKATEELVKKIEFGTPYGVVRSEKDLRSCIKQAIGPKSPNWGTNLITVRDMLENACSNGLPYNVEDMRNDLLAFAANVDKYPEKWVEYVGRLSLKYIKGVDYSHSPFSPTAQEVKKVLNEKYGVQSRLEKGIDYGYGPVPRYTSYANAGHKITEGLFQFMQAAMNDLKHDREFKEMIKQAVKEAYEEL